MRFVAWWQKETRDQGGRAISVENMGSISFLATSLEAAKRSAWRRASATLLRERKRYGNARKLKVRITSVVDENGKIHRVNWPLHAGVFQLAV